MFSEISSATDKFFVILDHFLPFTPLPEKSKFGKNEKKA